MEYQLENYVTMEYVDRIAKLTVIKTIRLLIAVTLPFAIVTINVKKSPLAHFSHCVIIIAKFVILFILSCIFTHKCK